MLDVRRPPSGPQLPPPRMAEFRRAWPPPQPGDATNRQLRWLPPTSQRVLPPPVRPVAERFHRPVAERGPVSFPPPRPDAPHLEALPAAVTPDEPVRPHVARIATPVRRSQVAEQLPKVTLLEPLPPPVPGAPAFDPPAPSPPVSLFAPPVHHPPSFPPPQRPPVTDGQNDCRRRRRVWAVAGGAVVAAMILAGGLVAFGVFDSAELSADPEQIAPPVGESDTEPVPSEGAPPTGTDVDTANSPVLTTPGEAPDAPATSVPVDELETSPPPPVPDERDSSTETAPPTSVVDSDDAAAGTEGLPLGTSALVGERYVVTVLDVDQDATDLIVAEDPLNEPPPPGEVYVMVTLEVQFVGIGQGEPYFDLLVGAVSEDGRDFNDIDCVAVAPDDLYGLSPLVSGQSVVGTFCLVVPSELAEPLLFFVEEYEPSTGVRAWWRSG